MMMVEIWMIRARDLDWEWDSLLQTLILLTQHRVSHNTHNTHLSHSAYSVQHYVSTMWGWHVNSLMSVCWVVFQYSIFAEHPPLCSTVFLCPEKREWGRVVDCAATSPLLPRSLPDCLMSQVWMLLKNVAINTLDLKYFRRGLNMNVFCYLE